MRLPKRLQTEYTTNISDINFILDKINIESENFEKLQTLKNEYQKELTNLSNKIDEQQEKELERENKLDEIFEQTKEINKLANDYPSSKELQFYSDNLNQIYTEMKTNMYLGNYDSMKKLSLLFENVLKLTHKTIKIVTEQSQEMAKIIMSNAEDSLNQYKQMIQDYPQDQNLQKDYKDLNAIYNSMKASVNRDKYNISKLNEEFKTLSAKTLAQLEERIQAA